jgi:hypothetical protein
MSKNRQPNRISRNRPNLVTYSIRLDSKVSYGKIGFYVVLWSLKAGSSAKVGYNLLESLGKVPLPRYGKLFGAAYGKLYWYSSYSGKRSL